MNIESIAMLALQTFMASALAVSTFCRLQKTDADTRREVRLVFWFMHLSALIVLVSPVMPLILPEFSHWKVGTTPAWIWLVLLLSIVLVQICTSKHWNSGVPDAFKERRQT